MTNTVPRVRCLMLAIAALWLTGAGCAADQVTTSAGDAAKAVSAFQIDLANLQTDLTDYQNQQASVNAERTVDTAASLATTAQAQSVMSLLNCTSPNAVFSTLQSFGNAITTNELAAAPVAASAPTLPTNKLGAVAASLTKLSQKPGTGADIDALLAYGTSVGNSLKIPTPTASTPTK